MATPPLDAPDIADERSLSVRRKRRFSSSSANANIHNDFLQAEADREDDPTDTTATTTTPAKPKKKVRFSDPGPNVLRPLSSASTGLTPHLRRTSFEPHTRDARDSSPPRTVRPQAARRRVSMPALTRALPSPSLSPPPQTISGVVQYKALRDILEPRVKRHLRRNGLSEEYNNIEAETKARKECLDQIENYKKEITSLEERKNQSQGNKIENQSIAQQIQETEEKLVRLKEEEAGTPSVENIAKAPMRHDESGIFIDDTAIGFDKHFETTERLQSSTPDTATPSTTNEIATQVSIPHPEQHEMLREARLSLEYLFPGEIALGLIPENPQPLFEVMLERLQQLKTDCLVAEDTISTAQTSESNLRTQFNAVLEQLNRARKYSEQLIKEKDAEKIRAEKAEARIPLMEISTKEATEKAQALQKENHEKDRSIRKLRNSLESYRVEVSKLENLINEQEAKHEEAMAAVRAEMDEAVADLECTVATEALGRREAEREVAERDSRIKELQHREQELVATVNEKQKIIREMESTWGTAHLTREQEVGQLNVQISTLSSNLSNAVQQRAHAERARDVLMRKLEDEKNAGLRAIDALRAELDHFTRNSDGIKAAYASDSRRRGAEVAEHQGLLTPVTETRFRDIDVPGYVEIKRGKGKRRQRPDSGIAILEEDEDESMADFVGM